MNLANSQDKVSTQKSLAFLYINNEKSDRKIKESIPLTFATKRIKYLGISLPKEIKELYMENYKTLMKGIRFWRAKTKSSVHQEPGERSSVPTRD